ncbi:hypothetical protein [Paenisporosarcina sp. OV554]|uniref:hypothetical protein n=1 Tax=Paenisporosarcina sp. OV554 TaxID=2135694 RepID=UPI000D38AB6A|nr:hypothetical protein [Paenisporosarcina sp. OV554]PUB12614.1 hypothetical protein C8K15_109113 [Paenisporosarcina sp. OV554]
MEKMVVTTINDKTFTFEGDVVQSVKKYFETSGHSTPLGWVGAAGHMVNFNHVVHIEFKSDKKEPSQ